MPFTKNELKKIREELPRGAGRKLSSEFNMTYGAIRNILSGRSNNDEVILAAYEMAKEHQSKIQQTKQALSAA